MCGEDFTYVKINVTVTYIYPDEHWLLESRMCGYNVGYDLLTFKCYIYDKMFSTSWSCLNIDFFSGNGGLCL